MRIKEIVSLETASVNPMTDADLYWHLYSLPSFDDGKQRECVLGSDIQSNKYVVPNKCILFNKLNVRFKRIWRIDNTDEHKICSTEFLPLVVDENIADYDYVYYLLNSDRITTYLCGQNSNTSGSHKRIDPNNFMNIEVNLPSLNMQHSIGSTLASIDAKIELDATINQNLEAMAKQLYDYWFVQFDFPNEEGKPYKSSGGKMVWNEKLKREIPEQWTNKTLRELINLEDTKRIPLSTKEREERKGTYPYYGATGIMGYVNDYVVDGDYLLLAEDGSTSDSNGNPIVQYIWGKNWINNHAHIINPKSENQLYFFSFLLKSIPAVLIETGSIQKKISQDNLLSFYVVSPTESIVQRYSDMVNVLQEMRKSNFDNIIELTKQRDELLPLLMNGQVAVSQ